MKKTAIAVLTLLVAAGSAFARTDVSITDSGYVPANVFIQLNDDVHWTNDGALPHTVTSDTGLWDSGTLLPGQKFERVFSQAGGFKYHCKLHPELLKGVVNVANTAVAPASMGRIKALFK